MIRFFITHNTISMVQSTLIIFNYVCLVLCLPVFLPTHLAVKHLLLCVFFVLSMREKVNVCIIVLFIIQTYLYAPISQHIYMCVCVCVMLQARTIKKNLLAQHYKKTHTRTHKQKSLSVLYKYIIPNVNTLMLYVDAMPYIYNATDLQI